MLRGSGKKRPRQLMLPDDHDDGIDKIYQFKVLLPNGMTVGLRLTNPKPEIPVQEFVYLVKDEYFRSQRQSPVTKGRPLKWTGVHLYCEDAHGNMIRDRINFRNFNERKIHILRLLDGSREIVDTYENMWDLTPDTELLRELPEEYTYETALADLIDNSLQAVWSIGQTGGRLISCNIMTIVFEEELVMIRSLSVDIMDDKISIFDTGPGMDASEENSIVKWGKMGASLTRSFKARAIGGKPPYLMPYFGMFGYGGSIASMHLGRCASVSSKTTKSEKVYSLHLEREALLRCSSSESTWGANGGIREPSKDELERSEGSFTKVEILEPNIKISNIFQLQCKLKDIYFPYIQCDEVTNNGKTTTPVKFQVNGVDLAEIEGGEISITNLHSCNGPEFIFHLHFITKHDKSTNRSPGFRSSHEANARLKCVYVPIVEGKENIDRILEKLKDEKGGTVENFETFSRVSVRRLGRLLPDARWAYLPFMQPRPKKGDKAHLLKRCCLRVKCYIETDAGFNPTPSKTELAHQNPFTIALKNFGNQMTDREKDVNVEISCNGKSLTLLQLEKAYEDWILQMHDKYDEETDAGDDEPILIVGLDPKMKKSLHISSDVVRLHQALKRKGASWKSGQRIKILKGACPGIHKQNVYATLEHFLIEGFQGDAGGEARILCRPIGVDNGCLLLNEDGNLSLDIRGSLSLPISVIDSGKCLAIGSTEWDQLLQKQCEKAPSMIELLSAEHCQQLGLDGAVSAGEVVPSEIVAVVRPGSYVFSSTSSKLDQKYIFKNDLDMTVVIRREGGDCKSVTQIYSQPLSPSSHKGLSGLYIFSLGEKLQNLLKRAGVYKFLFSISDQNCKSCEKRVEVRASSEVGKWKLLGNKLIGLQRIRVGSAFPTIDIACFDTYNNQIPITLVPVVNVQLNSRTAVIAEVDKVDACLSADELILQIKGIRVESSKLDQIRPSYEANLIICLQDDLAVFPIPCRVIPGLLQNVIVKSSSLEENLHPDFVVKELVLEMFDSYCNHVEEGSEVQLIVDGFHVLGQRGLKHKVDDHGSIDLSGLLKVTAGFGKIVLFSILSDEKVVFKQEFQTVKRELRLVSSLPESCAAGSQLENVVFEVVNSQGEVDDTIHHEEKNSKFHLLTINSDSYNSESYARYSFRHGRCTIPAIPIPPIEGNFCFIAAHSRYPELQLSMEVSVMQNMEVLKTESQSPRAERRVLLTQDSPILKLAGDLTPILVNKGKVLEKYGERIGSFERALKMLNDKKADLEQTISELQDSLESHSLSNLEHLSTKEEVMAQIQKRNHSAAAIFFRLSVDFPLQVGEKHLSGSIVGLVALLGSVCNKQLSRVLAEYLGEDQMLALVCGSYEAVSDLEKYAETGEADHGLDIAEATTWGKPLCGRFDVICLEDIRPYTGQFDRSDPQRKLILPPPTLPGGVIPSGFMGYAVNMVNLDNDHLSRRTAAGHGLRETMLYRLLGRLQVYETREQMKKARVSVEHGAVSLDGGILRENGMISLGYGNPEICFPVVISEDEENVEVLKDIQLKKAQLKDTMDTIEMVTQRHNKCLKKFKRKSSRYHELCDVMDFVSQ